jgi:hypothetical protein
MSNQNIRPALLSLLFLLFATFMGASIPARADFQKELSVKGERLILGNLIGKVQLVGTEGSEFKIHLDVRGEDASEDLIQLKSEREGDEVQVLVQFPIDTERDYVYPALGKHSHTRFSARLGSGEHRSWFSKLFGSSDRIEVRGSGKGLKLWADLRIEVPKGKESKIYLGCGSIDAKDVTAALSLDTHSGPVSAQRIHGDLLVDTGSGHVSLADLEGDVNVDTGSGHVKVDGLKGNLIADTGSGHVELSSIEGDKVEVDTGSGGVNLDTIRAKDLDADTGSGSVVCRNVLCVNLVVDTGSGGIELVMPEETSARIEADTGSGGIEIDFAGAKIEKKSKDYALLTVGAGEGRYSLDTGSGRIRIH